MATYLLPTCYLLADGYLLATYLSTYLLPTYYLLADGYLLANAC